VLTWRWQSLMPSIDQRRWAALLPHLDHALDLPDAERSGWLDELRQRDPTMADDLEALLDRHRVVADEHFLEGSALRLQHAPALEGQTLGAYTLKSPIGAGGMSSVWLAERSDGRFERQAAVKFLNVALAGPGERRFKQEGRILARLTHPKIAYLVDAGVMPPGQPYLVLEYVDGQAIDRYCELNAVDVPACVRLFIDVLSAVAHAHASLIVHRDIKPSNVLVTRDGQVKLLDFGVAKLLESEGAHGPGALTRDGGRALTPAYAAPEQLTGETVSTATDVYALGVLLFVLLTRQHPAAADLGSPAALTKAIVDAEPRRPSDVTGDARLRRQLRGDLDTIVLTAMKKVPAERYASVTALADDLHRYLRHETIRARPETLRYRTAKFVRRHRWPVAAAVVVIALLSAGLVTANRQRQIAEQRFRQLRHLSEQAFALDNRIRDLPGATDARQALVAASLEYLGGLAPDTGGDLDLMQEVSDGYWRVARIQGVPIGLTLGNFVKAEENLAKAQSFVDAVLVSRPRDKRALERAALIAQDRMVLAQSEHRNADAMSFARAGSQRADALLADGQATESQRRNAMGIYGNIAVAHVNMHLYEDGVRYATRQLEVARSLGSTSYTVSFALSVLANARRLQGDLDGALKAIREARTIADQGTYASEGQRMNDRYGILLREGLVLGSDRGISLERPLEASVAFREAFELTQAGARRDPKDFTSRSQAGTAGRELGDILRWSAPAEAVVVYDTALARLSEIQGNLKARRDRALTLAHSTYALRRLQRSGEAERRLTEALSILQDTGDYPAERIQLDSELFAVLQAQADYDGDAGHHRRAVTEYERLLESVMATKPDVENDLRSTYALSGLYKGLAGIHRAAGAPDQADDVELKRRALWHHWNQKLPNNSFVLRRLAE
jgi:serine/threonine protein kinase